MCGIPSRLLNRRATVVLPLPGRPEIVITIGTIVTVSSRSDKRSRMVGSRQMAVGSKERRKIPICLLPTVLFDILRLLAQLLDLTARLDGMVGDAQVGAFC